ncbi:MAG TPA: FadR/GntR family transcriptional regulator [Ktedonobacteraceae bacterium]
MTSSLPSLQRQTLAMLVAREIGLRIMSNDFKPGDALVTEPVLSLQLNVSRSVLREALKMLDAKGLIESRPKIGTRVRQRANWNLFDPDVIAWQNEVGPNRQFLLDICEVRLMFEPVTAGLAATRASTEEVALVEQGCQAMQEAVDAMADYIVADLQFHTAICLAAHNEFLGKIITTLDAPLRSSRFITSRLPGANQKAMPLHRAVADAIKNRDIEAAEEAMRKLVLQTTEDIKRAFDE